MGADEDRYWADKVQRWELGLEMPSDEELVMLGLVLGVDPRTFGLPTEEFARRNGLQVPPAEPPV